MAPVKNPNANCTNNNANTAGNININNNNNSSAVNYSSTTSQKQTGTVPKTSASASCSSIAAVPIHRIGMPSSRNSAISSSVGNKSGKGIPTTGSRRSTSSNCQSATTTMHQQGIDGVGASLDQHLVHQQFGSNSMSTSASSQRKNTEIVAPIRRELKDLKDYLLSAVATETQSQQSTKLQNSISNQNGYTSSPQQQQQQHHIHHQQNLNDSSSSYFELDNCQEQQRFCYPVRPVPRRNTLQQQRERDSTVDSNYYPNLNSGTASSVTLTAASSTTSVHNLNPVAAVGVVIPTTPAGVISNNSSNEEPFSNVTSATTRNPATRNSTNLYASNNYSQQNQLLLNQLQQQIDDPLPPPVSSALHHQHHHHHHQHQNYQRQQQQQQQSSFHQIHNQQILPTNLLDLAAAATTAGAVGGGNDLTFLQRLNCIQYILSLTTKPNSAAPTSSSLSQDINKHRVAAITKNMPNDNNPTTTTTATASESEVIVNSASLEDVALSEQISDNRAQSITSLHSATDPPETPTYEDLQQRLELSNRNIQSMHEQQRQLLHLHNQAKQHLSEMETLRDRTAPLSFAPNGNNGPEYESVEQVHTDMASLVSRMKNLTSFIHGQHELSALLGEDGPEILAEQEALQRKLDGLKSHREEMKNLVGELQEVNRSAERSAAAAAAQQREQQQQENSSPQPSGSGVGAARIVPVEYSRIVPIELVGNSKQNGNHYANANKNDINADTGADDCDETDDADPETVESMRKNISNVNAMKNQLKRLKEMMDTIQLIEDRTAGAKDPKDIGYIGDSDGSIEIPVQREYSPKHINSNAIPFDKDRTPTADEQPTVDQDEEAAIAEKVRMLNEVTRDLRSQALSLKTERDRIRSLKEEIIRRRELNVTSDDGSKNSNHRENASPSKLVNKDAERDLLKAEYQAKKKEFEQICQRLRSEDGTTASDAGCCVSAPTPSPATATLLRQTRQLVDNVEQVDDEQNDSDYNSRHVESDAASKQELGTFFADNWHSQSLGVSCNSSVHSGGDGLKAPPRDKEGSVQSGTAADMQGGGAAASLEAGSMQSGSSQSYSMPPPMRSLGNREASSGSWRKSSQEHQLYDHHSSYGTQLAPSSGTGTAGVISANGCPIPPPLPTAWNPHYFYGAASFTPPLHHLPGSSNDCICSATSNALSAAAHANNSTATVQPDSVLLQQFVQTQQMLINSVCQCNQMLWHQQREIDSLNSTIHVLQERLLSLTGPCTVAADPALNNIRAESVPPTAGSASAALHNNLYAAMNRAQSEQPGHYTTPLCTFTDYQHRHHLHRHHQHQQQYQQQHHNMLNRNRGGGFHFTESQMHHLSHGTIPSTSSNLYATLNNLCPQGAAAQQPSQQQAPQPPATPSATFNNVHSFNNNNNNNDPHQSPLASVSHPPPGPIFMHHHNNTIHQNNSNLHQQQQLQQQAAAAAAHQNNNSSDVVTTSTTSNLQSATTGNLASSALNNQVPPGNRANNYWDNFRSYSRQNLLSTNSCKSNEEQNHNFNQQQLQVEQQQQQMYNLSDVEPSPPPQPPPSQQPQLSSNNLNLPAPPSLPSSENFAFNRNRINQTSTSAAEMTTGQQQQQDQPLRQYQRACLQSADVTPPLHFNIMNSTASANHLLENLNWSDASSAAGDVFENSLSNETSPMTSILPTTTVVDIRNMNMNLNFGNNNVHQLNKVPAKLSCRGTAVVPNRIRAQSSLKSAVEAQQPTKFGRNIGSSGVQAVGPSHSMQQNRYEMMASTSSSSGHCFRRTPQLVVAEMAGAADNDLDFGPSLHPSASVVAATGEDDDDTTSDEIKRNLLVNALKSDKFTTKFYESIKEDVFRRLESLLLDDKESGAGDRQKAQMLSELFNDCNIASSRVPLKKFYLNEFRSLGSQRVAPARSTTPSSIIHQHQPQPPPSPTMALQEFNADTESNNADNEVDVDEDEDRDERSKDEDADNDDNDDDEDNDTNQRDHSKDNEAGNDHKVGDREEDDYSQDDDQEEEGSHRRKHYRHKHNALGSRNHQVYPRVQPPPGFGVNVAVPLQQNILNNNSNDNDFLFTLGLSAKDMKFLANEFGSARKNPTRHYNESDDDEHRRGMAAIAAADCQQMAINTNNTKYVQYPDYDLINYLIARVHNETQANTIINDAVLVEIAKLTAAVAQNSVMTSMARKRSETLDDHVTNISPKKIYAKMKKNSFPRNRDNFLIWYQSFLESLLVVTATTTEPQKQTDRVVCCSTSPWNSSMRNGNYPLTDGGINNSRSNQNEHTFWSEWRKQSSRSTVAPTMTTTTSSPSSSTYTTRKSNIPNSVTQQHRLWHSSPIRNATETENKIENNSTMAFRQRSHKNPHSMLSHALPTPSAAQALVANVPDAFAGISNNIMNDEDLAEADQTCSANSSSHHQQVETQADIIPAAEEEENCAQEHRSDTDAGNNGNDSIDGAASGNDKNAESQIVSHKAVKYKCSDIFADEEVENNENPEEEGAACVLCYPAEDAEEDAATNEDQETTADRLERETVEHLNSKEGESAASPASEMLSDNAVGGSAGAAAIANPTAQSSLAVTSNTASLIKRNSVP